MHESRIMLTSQSNAANGGGLPPTGPLPAINGADLVSAIETRLDKQKFQDQHWSGTL